MRYWNKQARQQLMASGATERTFSLARRRRHSSLGIPFILAAADAYLSACAASDSDEFIENVAIEDAAIECAKGKCEDSGRSDADDPAGALGAAAGAAPSSAGCDPINLTTNPAVDQRAPAIAYNAADREYGVVFFQKSGSITNPWEAAFVRTDLAGNILAPGPTVISGSSLPPIGAGYMTSDLAYVPSTDRWVVSYHREGPDQAYVTMFDDNANP